ncbi:hypothetical protein GGI21_001769 [Coemansia aciculifera]|nr:hypothetical protein GGI21_001769 [Coemansia aciculifera]
MPSLRHLFDLLVVARPISEIASQVLLLLLQRFDEPGGAVGDSGPYGFPASGLSKWYETDVHLLHDAARTALSRIVALGINSADAASNDDLSVGTPRSVSPEMPVLVIDSERLDEQYLAYNSCEYDDAVVGDDVASVDVVSVDSLVLEDDDMLAQLDLFDKELDEALCA